MEWELWSRRDEKGLARYVTAESKQWLPLAVNRSGLTPTAEGRRMLVAAIYEALASKGIRYSNEEYHPSNLLQPVRKPTEIMHGAREGTCLDLAALFCGACIGYDLLPMLVVLDGHALALVSVARGLGDWNAYRPERDWVEHSAITDVKQLRELLKSGTHIAVECTGFAQSAAANGDGDPARRKDGTLSFEGAVDEGRRHIDSGQPAFRFALDIAVAHYYWRIEPFPVTNVLEHVEQAPLSLSSLVRVKEFKAVLGRTPHFVGRASIFEKIDEAVADRQFPSGYILVRGEPGIGKTALLAELVRRRNYVHHFNIAPDNIRAARQFLQSVCAQLIVEYKLAHNRIEEEQLNDSGFLMCLLEEAR